MGEDRRAECGVRGPVDRRGVGQVQRERTDAVSVLIERLGEVAGVEDDLIDSILAGLGLS